MLVSICRQEHNIENGIKTLPHFNSTLLEEQYTVFYMDSFLPAEKYREDMVVAWKPPPR